MPVLLQTAWTTFRVRTICERAPLEIEAVSAGMGLSFLRQATCREARALVVPARADPPRKSRSGDEIVLERIEMEVRDV